MQWTSAEPGFEMAKAVVLSPSQINVWLDGRRKWAWQYLAKKPRASSASAEKGTGVHWQLERHLRGEGFDYSTPFKTMCAEIALLGVPYLPAPLTPGMRVENRLIGAPASEDRDFRFETRDGIVYRGRMDVTVPDSIVVPGLWGGVPACVDHKTSSNIEEYALSDQDLNTDTQAVVYAYYLMSLYQSPVVDLQWNYLPTRGAKVAQPRRLRVYSPRVVDEFHRVHAHGLEIAATYSAAPDPLRDLPPCNEHAGSGVTHLDPCMAYGGCPFRGFCTDVFSPLGFPIPRKVQVPIMNGTPAGQALMATLSAQAPPDPYLAYASWRATVPAAPADPQYGPFEARYQASLVPVAPPPQPPAPPVEALPPWATSTVDPLTGRGAPVPPAINPPEYQAAPSLEQRAAVLSPAAPKEKAKRVRRTQEQIAADAAKAPAEFTIFVLEIDGTYTQETVTARAVFVR